MGPDTWLKLAEQLPMVVALIGLVMFYENARSKEREQMFNLWTNHMTESNKNLTRAVTILEIIEKRINA